MLKWLSWITLALLLTAVLSFIPRSVKAVDNLPTLWIKVHRIQAVDPIENWLEDGADWHYYITVSDGETTMDTEFKCPSGADDIVVDHIDTFANLRHKDISASITLKEDDLFGQETADISSSGLSFDCIYHLKTNDFEGDSAIVEQGYNKTSGDYDGSIGIDENDANLWFIIWDNYEPPIASAGIDQQCYTGDKVNFDGSGSTASSGSSIVKYQWDFENDGIIDAEGASASFTFQNKGLLTCRLRVTDSIGELADDTCLIDVRNRSPRAEFAYSPTSLTVRDIVSLIDQSSDPDGHLVSWSWKFGDGMSSTLQNPTYTFAQKGNHEVTLTVTDNDGAQNSITRTIVVSNLPPESCFNCTTNPRANTDAQFTDKTTDPENISLSSWLWDFGDGYTSDIQNPVHRFTSKGDYNVTLAVRDDEGATDIFSMMITVTETPPAEVPIPIPLWIVASAIIVILVASASAIYVRRRHKAKT